LLSGAVLRSINFIFSAVSSFLLMPFIVHHLGDRLYGFWSLAATFIGYYGLLDFGLSSAVSQYICIAIGKKNHQECQSVFNAALRIQGLLGCVALLVTAAIAAAAPWLCRSPADASLFWKVIAILGVNVAIGFPFKAYGGLLDAELRFEIQSVLSLLGIALRTGLTVLAVVMGGGVLALAWANLVASLPVIVLQVWFGRRVAPWARIDHSRLDPRRAKSFFSYSIYTFLSIIGDIFRFQLDSLVTAAIIGLAAVTHYRVASVFTKYYIDAIASIISLIQPVLSRLHGAEDRAGLIKVFFFATKVSLCSSMFIGVSLICWGKPLIARWMGLSYGDAYGPLVVLSLAVLLDVAQCPSISLLYATFNHRFYTYLNGAEGVINLVFSVILARSFGLLGVALGTLIGAFVVRVIAQPLWVCKAAGLQYREYMKFLGGMLIRCSLAMAGAIATSAWGLRPSYAWLVASAVCATVAYGLGAYFLVFNKGDRDKLLVAARLRNSPASEPVTATALTSSAV
jgi:O-antigen/teichoic acid export membrane protein